MARDQGNSTSQAMPDADGLRAFIAQAPFSVQILSPDGRTLSVNRAWEELWGATLDDLAGYNMLQDPQLEAKGVAPYIRRAFAGESVRIPAIEYDPNETLPNATRHADPRRWVSAVAYPVLGANGEIREIVLIHDDITARRRAEIGLRQSEERFRRLTDANLLGIITATDKLVLSSNDEFLRMVGYTRADLETGGLSWPQMTPPEYAHLDARGLAQLADRGNCDPFEKEFYRKDGSRVPVLIGAAKLDTQPPSWICFVIDQTQSKAAEAAVRASETRFRTLADHAPIPLALARNGLTLYANAAYRTAFGLGDANLVGRSLLDQVAPPDRERIVDYVRRRRAGENVPRSYGFTGLRSDGSHFPAHAEVSQIQLPDGAATIAFIIDRTEQQLLQESEKLARLEAERANRTKDDFLAALSHELRTPLSPALLLASSGAQNEALPPDVREDFDAIRANIEMEARLIDDLLDLTSVTRGKIQLHLTNVDIATIVRSAVAKVSHLLAEKQQQLEVAVRPARIVADALRVEQIFWNLLTNASKFSPPGSVIRISSAATDRRDVVEIVVQDEGPGIRTEELERIFLPFEQVHQRARGMRFGGLGLGLPIARNLAVLHGGTIRALSEGEGKGATFVVTLPAQ